MSMKQFLFSGFGGQGILFSGKFIAYKGLMDGKNVSWLPSYGPEMRGGTASCGVIVGDEAVGSPIGVPSICSVSFLRSGRIDFIWDSCGCRRLLRWVFQCVCP